MPTIDPGGRRASTSQELPGSWRMVEATEQSYPGRAHDDHDLDDFDELLKVSQCDDFITPVLSAQTAVSFGTVKCLCSTSRAYWLITSTTSSKKQL